MPTKQELYEALRKADAAGDTAAAERFAERIRNYDSADTAEPAQEQSAQPESRPSEEFEAGGNNGWDRFWGNFGRGVGRIRRGEVQPQEVADLGEGFLRSVTAPIGGDYVAAGAAELVDFIEGDRGGPSQLSQQRARREELAEDAPVMSTSAEALGFGGLMVPLRAAWSRAPQAVQGMFRAAPTAGTVAQRGQNALRAAGEGAAVAGIGETLKTGDTERGAEAAVTGAVTTPAASGAMRFVGDRMKDIPRYLKAVAGSPADSSIQAIAKRTDMPVEDVRLAYNNYLEVNGKPPSLAEISDPVSIRRFKNMAQDNRQASAVLDDAEVETGRQRARDMQETIQGQAPRETARQFRDLAETQADDRIRQIENLTDDELDRIATESENTLSRSNVAIDEQVAAQEATAEQARRRMQSQFQRNTRGEEGYDSIPRMTKIRDDWADSVMEKIDTKPVVFSAEMTEDFLQRPAIRDNLVKMARAAASQEDEEAVMDLIEQIGTGKAVSLTLRQVDNLRKILTSDSVRGEGLSRPLGQVAQRLRDQAEASIPAYRTFLDQYGKLSRQIEGFEQGMQVTNRTGRGRTEYRGVVADADPATRSGQVMGARTAVGDTAAQSPKAAERVARDLVENDDVYREAVGPSFERLNSIAQNGIQTIDDAAAVATRLKEYRTETQRRLRDLERSRSRAATQEGQQQIQQVQRELSQLNEMVRLADNIAGSTDSAFADVMRQVPPQILQRLSNVARTSLADDAGQSAGAAIRVARQMQEPGFERRARQVMGDDEAARLREVGRTQTQSAENMRNLSPRVGEPDELSEATAGAAEAAAMLMGRYGPQGAGVFVAGLVRRLQQVGVPPGTAQKVAESITDPAKTAEIIRRLEAVGVNRAEMQQAIQSAVAAATASLSSEESTDRLDGGKFELQE